VAPQEIDLASLARRVVRFYDRPTSTTVRIAQRPRPGWWQTGWSICLAYIAAALTLGIASFPLFLVGVFDWNANAGVKADRLLTGPYRPAGAWAAAADVAIGVVVVVVTSALVQRAVWARTGFHVGIKTVVSTMALTGIAPYLAVNARAVSGFGALVAATAVLRLFAVERETEEPLPLRQIGWCVAVAAVLSVSYVSFHPLQFDSLGGATLTSVSIKNAGLAPATLLAVSTPAQSGLAGHLRPLRGATIPARGHLWITLKTRAPHPCPPDVVTVRYRLLGQTLSQPLVLGGRCFSSPTP
jgi:hypothetical protein